MEKELQEKAMTPNQFYHSKTKEHVALVSKAAGTSFGNFRQIAIANGSVSSSLAEKLAVASSYEMTELEILYPERYEKQVLSPEQAA